MRLVSDIETGLCQPELRVGDVVIATPPYSLHSGASLYDDAIVISVHPLRLASRQGDMLWSHIHFALIKVGHVGWWKRRRAMARLR